MKKLLILLFIPFLLIACEDEEPARKKKLVTIGDSLTSSLAWQPAVVNALNLDWSPEETDQGKDGYPRMAFGGTTIRAYYDPNVTNPNDPHYQGNSIYTRGKSAHHYKPDIIIILNTGSEGRARGSINDAPYTGEELPYNSPSINDVISYPCYKGLIETLAEKNPTAKIYIMTPPIPRMNRDIFSSEQEMLDYLMTFKYSQVVMVRELAAYYNLPLIDLWESSGITIENAPDYYPAPGANNEWEVHPNQSGYDKIAEAVRKALSQTLNH